jgi:hypothetical protein
VVAYPTEAAASGDHAAAATASAQEGS